MESDRSVDTERGGVLFQMFGKFFPQGTILFSENDRGDEMYFIQSGSVRVRTAGAQHTRSDVFTAGDIVGEEGFTGRATRGAVADILEDSRLLVINADNLESLARTGPQLSTAIVMELTRRVERSSDELQDWQRSRRVRKVGLVMAEGDEEKTWSVEELLELSGISENGVRSAAEFLVGEGGLAVAVDGYTVRDLSTINALASREQPSPESLNR